MPEQYGTQIHQQLEEFNSLNRTDPFRDYLELRDYECKRCEHTFGKHGKSVTGRGFCLLDGCYCTDPH